MTDDIEAARKRIQGTIDGFIEAMRPGVFPAEAPLVAVFHAAATQDIAASTCSAGSSPGSQREPVRHKSQTMPVTPEGYLTWGGGQAPGQPASARKATRASARRIYLMTLPSPPLGSSTTSSCRVSSGFRPSTISPSVDIREYV